jgi:hypothetical protein
MPTRAHEVERAQAALREFIQARLAASGEAKPAVRLTREEVLSWFLAEQPVLSEFRADLTSVLPEQGTLVVKPR